MDLSPAPRFDYLCGVRPCIPLSLFPTYRLRPICLGWLLGSRHVTSALQFLAIATLQVLEFHQVWNVTCACCYHTSELGAGGGHRTLQVRGLPKVNGELVTQSSPRGRGSPCTNCLGPPPTLPSQEAALASTAGRCHMSSQLPEPLLPKLLQPGPAPGSRIPPASSTKPAPQNKRRRGLHEGGVSVSFSAGSLEPKLCLALH